MRFISVQFIHLGLECAALTTAQTATSAVNEVEFLCFYSLICCRILSLFDP